VLAFIRITLRFLYLVTFASQTELCCIARMNFLNVVIQHQIWHYQLCLIPFTIIYHGNQQTVTTTENFIGDNSAVQALVWAGLAWLGIAFHLCTVQLRTLYMNSS
jgi:hypothetical protein